MPILVVSDFGFSGLLPHGDYAKELAVYPKLCGVSNLDVIRWATYNAAVFVGREHELGSVEQGKIADMLIIDGDPSKDLNVLADRSKIKAVIKNGEFVTRDLEFTRSTDVAA